MATWKQDARRISTLIKACWRSCFLPKYRITRGRYVSRIYCRQIDVNILLLFSRKRSAEVETQQQSWVVAFKVVSVSFFAFDIFFKLPSEKMHEALQRENVRCAIMVFLPFLANPSLRNNKALNNVPPQGPCHFSLQNRAGGKRRRRRKPT